MNIKDYLKHNNISIAFLNKITAIPYTTISEIVNGKVDIERTSVGNALKLAKACSLSFEDFYTLCKENMASFSCVANAKIQVRNKTYQMLYTHNNTVEKMELLKANNVNKQFVNDVALWELESFNKRVEQEKLISEVDDWKAENIT